MKRRVVRTGDRRFQVELPGGDVSTFSYREKPRKYDPDLGHCVDFDQDEDRYILSWEGVFMDTFQRETDALLFIIRFGYAVSDNELIPSEILADFDLVYEGGDWVDEWHCTDRNEVIYAMGKIRKPAKRNIRFEGYPRITPKKKSPYPTNWEQMESSRSAREVVATIEIPKLDFEELEKPRRRRKQVSRQWSDRSDPQYAAFMEWKLRLERKTRKRDRLSDSECTFTLRSGKDAEKVHEERKKSIFDLTK